MLRRLALKISIESGDVQAVRVMRWMQTAAVGIALSSSIDALLDKRAGVSYFAKPMITGTVVASYYPDRQTICLPDAWGLSDKLLAYLMIHESLHAYQHNVEGDTSAKRRQARELAAQAMDYRVLLSLLGQPFERALRDLLTEKPVSASQRESYMVPGTFPDFLTSYFGPSNNRSERKVRWIEVSFAARQLDRLLKVS